MKIEIEIERGGGVVLIYPVGEGEITGLDLSELIWLPCGSSLMRTSGMDILS